MSALINELNKLFQIVASLCEVAEEESAAFRRLEETVAHGSLKRILDIHRAELDMIQTLVLRVEQVRKSHPELLSLPLPNEA